MMGKDKIQKEKETIKFIVELYCSKKLKCDKMPDEYAELIQYAIQRLDRCKFGNAKSSCKKCRIHCYKRDKRERIREIMRWAGPRMFFYAPATAIRHIFM